MRKKIFLILTSLVFIFSCLFIPITAKADTNNVITYTDTQVYEDTSNLGNYAIQDIETLTINGALVFKATFIPLSDFTFIFLGDSYIENKTYFGNYFYLNTEVSDSQLDCNFAVRCLSSETGLKIVSSTETVTINKIKFGFKNLIFTANNIFEFYFSTASFGGTFDNIEFFTSENSDKTFDKILSNNDYDLSVFNDMDSNTNFTYSSFISDFEFYQFDHLSYYLSMFSLLRSSPSLSAFHINLLKLPSFTKDCSFGQLFMNSSRVENFGSFDFFYGIKDTSYFKDNSIYEYNFLYKEFYFSILRPVRRTNNTLIIYNYDYDNLINNVNGVTYQLQKGSNKYNVVYNGTLPNSTFIYVSNSNINNILFDQYIYFYLSFTGNLVSYDFINYDYFESTTFNMGFDFNFTYFNEPLVTSNGSYKFDFQKPNYVDMRFSLSPFYIPILEAVQNALIFLVFYCPLISDILEFIHLDQFFGAIFNIFSFSNGNVSILGINPGGFIWACIAFVIFFKLLQSFMPVLWSSAKDAGSFISDFTKDKITRKTRLGRWYSNKKRYRQEGIKADKEFKYNLYKDKRIEKGIVKAEKKYFKKNRK